MKGYIKLIKEIKSRNPSFIEDIEKEREGTIIYVDKNNLGDEGGAEYKTIISNDGVLGIINNRKCCVYEDSYNLEFIALEDLDWGYEVIGALTISILSKSLHYDNILRDGMIEEIYYDQFEGTTDIEDICEIPSGDMKDWDNDYIDKIIKILA